MWFGERDSQGTKKKVFEKTVILSPLKTDFSRISQVSDSQATSELLANCAKYTGQVLRVKIEWQSTNKWVAKLFAKICEETEISSFPFHGSGMSCEVLIAKSRNSLPKISKGLNFSITSHNLDRTTSTRKMSREIAKHQVFQHKYDFLRKYFKARVKKKNHF